MLWNVSHFIQLLWSKFFFLLVLFNAHITCWRERGNRALSDHPVIKEMPAIHHFTSRGILQGCKWRNSFHFYDSQLVLHILRQLRDVLKERSGSCWEKGEETRTSYNKKVEKLLSTCSRKRSGKKLNFFQDLWWCAWAAADCCNFFLSPVIYFFIRLLLHQHCT